MPPKHKKNLIRNKLLEEVDSEWKVVSKVVSKDPEDIIKDTKENIQKYKARTKSKVLDVSLKNSHGETIFYEFSLQKYLFTKAEFVCQKLAGGISKLDFFDLLEFMALSFINKDGYKDDVNFHLIPGYIFANPSFGSDTDEREVLFFSYLLNYLNENIVENQESLLEQINNRIEADPITIYNKRIEFVLKDGKFLLEYKTLKELTLDEYYEINRKNPEPDHSFDNQLYICLNGASNELKKTIESIDTGDLKKEFRTQDRIPVGAQHVIILNDTSLRPKQYGNVKRIFTESHTHRNFGLVASNSDMDKTIFCDESEVYYKIKDFVTLITKPKSFFNYLAQVLIDSSNLKEIQEKLDEGFDLKETDLYEKKHVTAFYMMFLRFYDVNYQNVQSLLKKNLNLFSLITFEDKQLLFALSLKNSCTEHGKDDDLYDLILNEELEKGDEGKKELKSIFNYAENYFKEHNVSEACNTKLNGLAASHLPKKKSIIERVDTLGKESMKSLRNSVIALKAEEVGRRASKVSDETFEISTPLSKVETEIALLPLPSKAEEKNANSNEAISISTPLSKTEMAKALQQNHSKSDEQGTDGGSKKKFGSISKRNKQSKALELTISEPENFKYLGGTNVPIAGMSAVLVQPKPEETKAETKAAPAVSKPLPPTPKKPESVSEPVVKQLPKVPETEKNPARGSVKDMAKRFEQQGQSAAK